MPGPPTFDGLAAHRPGCDSQRTLQRPGARVSNKLPSPISMRNARRTLHVCPLYPPALMSLPEERAAQMSSQALRSFSTLRVIFHARLKMLIVDNAAAGH